MDRKAIFEQALKETGSLVKAMELVKQIEGFLGSENLELKPIPKNPIPKIALESLQANPDFRMPRISLPRHQRTRKLWKPGEIAMAEAMLNQGKSIEDVAVATDRTAKAIRNALSVKVLNPSVDPRNPDRRASAYKAVVTRGEKIRDYNTAEVLIDSHDKKKG